MENQLKELADAKKVKNKYTIDTLMPLGESLWMGELNKSKYIIIIGIEGRTVKARIAETEYECMYDDSNWLNLARINNKYAGLAYLTQPINDCAIKLVLDLLEWKYDDDDIWC